MQVLYDFSGEPGSAELTITAGQTLTVIRRDVGEGWWEGANEQGKTGLFPAAYVEVCSSTLNLLFIYFKMLTIILYSTKFNW